jgi:uncharacterized membrane protein
VRRNTAWASFALALLVVMLPWFRLGPYEPNGWDATWWLRVALAAAVVNSLALRMERDRIALAAACVAVACIAVRIVAPPDFGFGFDGLKVSVHREPACWVGLALSLLALLGSARLAWRPERSEPPASPEPAAPPPPQAPSSAASSP